MLVTSDHGVWQRAWSLKDNGKSYAATHDDQHRPGYRWLYDTVGTNSRITELQAAIGRRQLRKLAGWCDRRRKNAALLAGVMEPFDAIRVPEPPAHSEHAHYRLYVHVLEDALRHGWSRDRIIIELSEQGVPAYWGSCPEIYRERVIVDRGLQPSRPLPGARSLGASAIAFLGHPTLTDRNLRDICRVLETVLGQASTTSYAPAGPVAIRSGGRAL